MITTWTNVLPRKKRPVLDEKIEADVVIVGEGITGVTLAYLLSRSGKKVVVLEKGTMRNGATAFTTALITYVVDTSLPKLVKMFDEDKAKQVWEAGRMAIDEIEEIIKNEKIPCGFMRCAAYLFATSDREYKTIREEADLGKRFGFDISTNNSTVVFADYGFARVANQAKFHPLKYVLGLRDRAERRGARFFENSEVLSLEGKDPVVVRTAKSMVKARDVVIATYDPFNHPKELFAHKGMYVSYVLEIEIPKNMFEEAIYQDYKNPYHYFRIDRQTHVDRMILGGEDHREEIALDEKKSYRALEKYFTSVIAPGMKYRVAKRWTGPILEPSDGLPYIGRVSKENPHVFVATAFSGNGMTYSMIAGKIISDLILERKNTFASVFDPLRSLTLKALWEKGKDYTGEFFGGAGKNIFK